MTTQTSAEAALTGPEAEHVLRTVLEAEDVALRDWRVRAVHRRGSTSLSVVYEGDITDERGRDRTLLYIGHSSSRAVPKGAAVVTSYDAPVHVWRFPDDPYLPGLRSAVSRREARALLDRLRLPQGTAQIHTRSYRPTRRAVVEISAVGNEEPLVYRKVLGGRSAAQIAERTSALVATHRHMSRTLPVPEVLATDSELGLVTLERLAGRTMRSLLRTGGALPPVGELATMVGRLTALPAFPQQAEPERYADISRHLRSLSALLPEDADTLTRIGEAVADIGGPRAVVHGDLHDGQLLVQDGRLTGLLDVDGTGEGLVAQDTGRLVANVQVAAEYEGAPSDSVRAYAERLRDALAEHAPARDTALGAAAAWIGLATGPYRVQSPSWPVDTRRRIAMAASWVDIAESS